MTTNVFDNAKNVLTTDSRWSFSSIKKPTGSAINFFGYVDNTGFDKLVYDDTAGFMFAGPGDLINAWREWVVNKGANLLLARPAVQKNFAICMVSKATGQVVVEHGQKITGDAFRFAGTGAEPAYNCWDVNRDPRKAVLSAQERDVCSGGEVKFFESDTGNHNVDLTVPFRTVTEKFLQEGRIMYSVGQTESIKDAAKKDPRVDEFVSMVKAGGIQAEAPSGRDPVIWTVDDEARLDRALNAHYGKK